MQEHRRYTTMWGQEILVPWAGEELKTHKAAKHMAVALMTPEQRVEYAAKGGMWVVDELGRKHHMMHVPMAATSQRSLKEVADAMQAIQQRKHSALYR